MSPSDLDENNEVRLYVGNISYDTTPDSLREAFKKFGGGDITDVFLPRNRRTGARLHLQGFAFVTLTGGMDVANNAIKGMDQTELDGQIICVQLSNKPRGGGEDNRAVPPRGDAFHNSERKKANDGGGGGGSSSNEEPYADIKPMATEFFHWLHQKQKEVGTGTEMVLNLTTGVDREKVGELFDTFSINNNNVNTSKNSSQQALKKREALVMACLRFQKLMKSQRYNDDNNSNNTKSVVICHFACEDGVSFAPIQERQTQRQVMRQERIELHENKEGISIQEEATTHPHKGPVLPLNEDAIVEFIVTQDDDELITLLKSIVIVGSHKQYFSVLTHTPSCMNTKNPQCTIQLKIRPTSTSVYRASLICTFVQVAAVTSNNNGRNNNSNNNNNNNNNKSKSFSIMRSILLRSGDADMYDVLKPTSPYQKKKKNRNGNDDGEPRIQKEDRIAPPPNKNNDSGGGGYNALLGQYRIPNNVRRLVYAKEMERVVVSPFLKYNNTTTTDTDTDTVPLDQMMAKLVLNGGKNGDHEHDEETEFCQQYTTFWQHLVWTSELQAYDDIQLFDMENVALQQSGRYYKLYVSGLAEGRPSVLRGDLVKCRWKTKEYSGRVMRVEQLTLNIEFDHSFHSSFHINVDRVDRIRFTFSRTPFRTMHAGIVAAPESLQQRMLLPTKETVRAIKQNSNNNNTKKSNSKSNTQLQRICPQEFRWTTGGSSLNQEQKQAVCEIVKGTCRPLPYIIFGPPGTGKTTTMVEAVYQLANLHTYDKKKKKTKKQLKKLKILLIAPSNDATDILVEKLAPYFPPSEMIRVLAYTRSIEQVSEGARPYCQEGLDTKTLVTKIRNLQITVATIQMAGRLWCLSRDTQVGCVPAGYFDVLCVDEAGHATEPEVISVAATLLKFHNSNNNNNNNDNTHQRQIVLAGDPQQLGPIITSTLCKKFQMDQSYMERLVKTSPAYKIQDNSDETYNPELVTLLVNNYRSHPDILKLPNEMFYRNQLIPSGDKFTTYNMTKWEHLPVQGFPILFHAVDGENTREGNSPSWFNPQEAMVVVDYVKNLVLDSKPKIRQEEIGIITPYARQVQKIRTALKVADIGDVKVGSVETFQGQERRVIIISTVRSQNDLLVHDRKYNLGFVANEKRFNVAITRAKALLIVVGNPRVLATDKKNWLPLLQFCRDKKSWLGEEWDESASSDDEDDVAFDLLNNDTIVGDDENEWATVVQEGHGFINREE